MDGLLFFTGFTVIGVAICMLVLWGTRGEPDEWPALSDGLGWWQRLAPAPDRRGTRAWSDRPGAFERSGLADRSAGRGRPGR